MQEARRTDQNYCGTPQGAVGPVETKLGSLGRVHSIVIGAFGEASDDLHSLIHHLALSRAEAPTGSEFLSLLRISEFFRFI